MIAAALNNFRPVVQGRLWMVAFGFGLVHGLGFANVLTELGLPAADDAPLLIEPETGAPVGGEAMPLHLRRARTTRVSIEANAGICRGMLRHRYAASGLGEEDQ